MRSRLITVALNMGLYASLLVVGIGLAGPFDPVDWLCAWVLLSWLGWLKYQELRREERGELARRQVEEAEGHDAILQLVRFLEVGDLAQVVRLVHENAAARQELREAIRILYPGGLH